MQRSWEDKHLAFSLFSNRDRDPLPKAKFCLRPIYTIIVQSLTACHVDARSVYAAIENFVQTLDEWARSSKNVDQI